MIAQGAHPELDRTDLPPLTPEGARVLHVFLASDDPLDSLADALELHLADPAVRAPSAPPTGVDGGFF